MDKKKRIIFEEFLEKINYRKKEEPRTILGYCTGCGELKLLNYEISISGKKWHCCGHACVKKQLYPYRFQILYPWRNGPRAKKYHRAGRTDYQKNRLTEPETEPLVYHVHSSVI